MRSSDKNIDRIILIGIITLWMSLMYRTGRSYFSIYMFLGILGIVGIFVSGISVQTFKDKSRRPHLWFAFILSLMIVLSNYTMFAMGSLNKNLLVTLFKCILAVVIWLFGAVAVFCLLCLNHELILNREHTHSHYSMRPLFFFCTVLAVLITVYSIVFWLCSYPGVLSPDSFISIRESLTGNYTNGNPFYYTILVGTSVKLGMFLFGDINAGVATYCFIQIIIMSAIFAYAVTTLYEMGVHRVYLVICILLYAFMPYYICFSFTMWKDVPFSGAITVLTVSLYRFLNHIGSSNTRNFILLIVGGLGMCILRHNGFYSFILFFMIICLVLREWRKNLVLYLTLFLIIVISYIMVHPVLNHFGVRAFGSIGPLCIPAQQISRVVVDGCELTDEQIELLDRIIDVDEISEKYQPHFSDPIVASIDDYYVTHKMDYLKLYIQIGLKYPGEYIMAWVDMTAGYWEGADAYHKWRIEMSENDLGIHHTVRSESLKNILYNISEFFIREDMMVLHPFASIGVYTWITLILCFMGFIGHDKVAAVTTIPALSVIAIFLIVVPSWTEFRYAYSSFCCVPFLCATVRGTDRLPENDS